MRLLPGLASLGVGLLVITAFAATQVGITNTGVVTPAILPHFTYVVTIVLENQGINNTYGGRCSGNCTYITSLAQANGLATQYSAIGHPSLPNYLALTSGGNYDTAPFDRDCNPHSSGCSVSSTNIIDRVVSSGRTWKAYVEDYTGAGCSQKGDSFLDNVHDPFLYYTDIYNNATRCSRIVDANPLGSGYLALPNQLIADLGSTTTASNYMWLTPNLCNDGHDICRPLNNTVSQQNQYLSMLVPQILNSPVFTTQSAALFITWDESATTANNVVTAIWAGSGVIPGQSSLLPHSHYSAVKTIETAWNLPTLSSLDSTATPMAEFFRQSP